MEWGRSFAFSACFAVLTGQGAARDAKDAKILEMCHSHFRDGVGGRLPSQGEGRRPVVEKKEAGRGRLISQEIGL